MDVEDVRSPLRSHGDCGGDRTEVLVTVNPGIGQPTTQAVIVPSTGLGGHAVPLSTHPRVLRKRLPPETFSVIENRNEFLDLEYTPYFAEVPVDVRFPTRCTRMGRAIDLVVGVIVPASVACEGLERTLVAISANLRYLSRSGWEWQRVAVVIVVDGLHCLSASMADYLRSSLRLYDPSLHASHVKGERVHMHVYERTLELPKHTQAREYYDPLQALLAVSTDQCGDMRSYQWLLNAFAQQLSPQYVVTFAAGVRPQPSCIARYLDAFRHDNNATLVLPHPHIHSSSVFHPLIMSQLFLTKTLTSTFTPMHSVCGYVPSASPACATVGLKHSVAIRWHRITPHVLGKFFECQDIPIASMGPSLANRQLTPLSVFAWEVCRSGSSLGDNTVVYESSAGVHVDVPQSILPFFDQQRIEHNGHLFNTLYYLYTAPRAMLCPDPTIATGTLAHTCPLLTRVCRFPAFLLQYCHVLLTLMGSFLAPAAMYLIMSLIIQEVLVESRFQLANGIIYGFKFVYVMMVSGQAIAALAVGLRDLRLVYTCIACVYGFMFAMVAIMAVWRCINQPINVLLLYGMAVCAGGHILCLLLHGSLYHACKSAVQFAFTYPVYFLMIPIHSYSNSDNVAAHRRYKHHLRHETDTLPTQTHNTFARPVEDVDKDVFDEPWDPEEVQNLVSVNHDGGALTHSHKPRVLETKRRFFAFRARLLVLWLGINWLAVTLINTFGFAHVVPWGLIGYGAYVTTAQTIGSVLYIVSRCLGACTRCVKRLCCCCCASSEPVAVAPRSGHPKADGNDDAQSGSYHSDAHVQPVNITRQSALSLGGSGKSMCAPKDTHASIGTELRDAERTVAHIEQGYAGNQRTSPRQRLPALEHTHSIRSARTTRQDSNRHLEREFSTRHNVMDHRTPSHREERGRHTPSHEWRRRGSRDSRSTSPRSRRSPSPREEWRRQTHTDNSDARSFRSQHSFGRKHTPGFVEVTREDDVAIAQAATLAMNMQLNPQEYGVRDILRSPAMAEGRTVLAATPPQHRLVRGATVGATSRPPLGPKQHSLGRPIGRDF